MSSGVYLVRVGTVLSAVGNGASGSVLLLFLASSMPAQLVAVPILFLSVGLSFGYLFCGPLVDSRHPLVVLVVLLMILIFPVWKVGKMMKVMALKMNLLFL